jgi:ATP-dependent Zn protease
MTRLIKPSRRRTAYHEAGHAVISHVLSVPIEHVTIRPDGETAGRLENVGGQPVTPTSDLHNAMVSFAGPIAEVLFCRKHPTGFGWGDDYADIRFRLNANLEMRLHYGELDPNASYDTVYRSLRAKTKRDALALVQKHKADIDCVAKALLKHDTLTRKQVRQLVQSGSREKPNSFPKQKPRRTKLTADGLSAR